MKSDKEMIESLIKRRDEYISQNKKRSSFGLIPKIALPSLSLSAVVICILAFNGAFDNSKVNIDLVGASGSNMPNISAPAIITADTSDKEITVTDYNYYFVPDDETDSDINGGITASDLLKAVNDRVNYVWYNDEIVQIMAPDISCPDRIVCGGTIYSLIDPQNEDYLSLGFDEENAILLDSLPMAAITENVVRNESGSVSELIKAVIYEIKGMENYVAAVFNQKLWLYRAEKTAYFIVGDNTYRACLPFADNTRYSISYRIADKNDEYTVYYAIDNMPDTWTLAEESGMPVYIITNNSYSTDNRQEAWICCSSNQSAHEE